MKTRLPPAHPDRLATQSALARAYLAGGRYAEAQELLETVVDARQSALPAGHPDLVDSEHQLARAYVAPGFS